jgi:hypothetical protein
MQSSQLIGQQVLIFGALTVRAPIHQSIVAWAAGRALEQWVPNLQPILLLVLAELLECQYLVVDHENPPVLARSLKHLTPLFMSITKLDNAAVKLISHSLRCAPQLEVVVLQITFDTSCTLLT